MSNRSNCFLLLWMLPCRCTTPRTPKYSSFAIFENFCEMPLDGGWCVCLTAWTLLSIDVSCVVELQPVADMSSRARHLKVSPMGSSLDLLAKSHNRSRGAFAGRYRHRSRGVPVAQYDNLLYRRNQGVTSLSLNSTFQNRSHEPGTI